MTVIYKSSIWSIETLSLSNNLLCNVNWIVELTFFVFAVAVVIDEVIIVGFISTGSSWVNFFFVFAVARRIRRPCRSTWSRWSRRRNLWTSSRSRCRTRWRSFSSLRRRTLYKCSSTLSTQSPTWRRCPRKPSNR